MITWVRGVTGDMQELKTKTGIRSAKLVGVRDGEGDRENERERQTYNGLVGIIVLHKLAVGFIAFAFTFRVPRGGANVSSTTTARVSRLKGELACSCGGESTREHVRVRRLCFGVHGRGTGCSHWGLDRETGRSRRVRGTVDECFQRRLVRLNPVWCKSPLLC